MDWLAAAFELTGMWLLANKNRWACYVFLVCEATWAAVAIRDELYGLLVVVSVGFILNCRIWWKWRK